MAIFWVPLLAVYCGRLFSGFWRAARNRQFPFTASLTTDSFLAPRLGGGTSGGLFSGYFMDCSKSTISLHSDFYKIQRIPFNRLLKAFLRAFLQQVVVEQIQRIPRIRLLTALLKALFQQAPVEQLQRIPFNRLLTAF